MRSVVETAQCLNCLRHNQVNNKFCQYCRAKLRLGERYRATRQLGEGTFGRTFMGIDEHRLDTPCVIKQLIFDAPDAASLEKATNFFKREAQRLAVLGKHSQIPDLLAFFSQEGKSYLVQDYIQGKDLFEELQQKQSYSEEEVKQFLLDLLPVLAFIHEQKIIHRDIKPENIIRREDGVLFLIDFGISKQLTKTLMTRVGTVVHTVSYAPPEQIRGMVYYSSDLYALGVTAIRLLTGCLPKEQNNSVIDEIYDSIDMEWTWREQLQQQGRSVNEEFGAVLDKLISEKPKNRYETAQEVLDALNSGSSTTVEEQDLPPQGLSSQGLPPQGLQPQHQPNPPNLTPSLTIHPLKSPKPQPKPSHIIPPATAKGMQLQRFSFETVKVDAHGDIIKRETKKANYFTVNLGHHVTLDMVAIPSGKFLMGAPESETGSMDRERPQHWVTLQSFFMGKYLITQGQYQAVMGNQPSGFQGKNRPVEKIFWKDAVKFCQRLSQKTGLKFSLPSESQWEYACRAISPLNPLSKGCLEELTPFCYGETLSTAIANYDGNYTYGQGRKGIYRQKTTEVGIFPANEFGLYDMHGNVWEWCADNWHSNYEGAPNDGSAWIDKKSNLFIARGGSWLVNPLYCCSANRNYFMRDFRYNDIGFRVVCVV